MKKVHRERGLGVTRHGKREIEREREKERERERETSSKVVI